MASRKKQGITMQCEECGLRDIRTQKNQDKAESKEQKLRLKKHCKRCVKRTWHKQAKKK